MIHPHTELRRVSEAIGYGVFATRRIPRGTITWTLCALDRVFPPAAVAAMDPIYQSILARYAYLDADGQFILCWDLARQINHSCEPSNLAAGPAADIAVRDIERGEQLTCEYGVLNTVTLECRCGAPACRGVIRADDAVRYGDAWDRRVREALPLARTVDQPLWPFVKDKDALEAILSGRAPLPRHRDYYCPHPALSPDTLLGMSPEAREPASDRA